MFFFSRQHKQCGYPMSMHPTSIGIFTECRLKDSRICSAKRLRNQINGFCGSIRHTHLFRLQAMFFGKSSFQRVRLRFGIATYLVHTSTQMFFQSTEVHSSENIRTEIRRYRATILIGIIAMSFNHVLLSVFDRQAVD